MSSDKKTIQEKQEALKLWKERISLCTEYRKELITKVQKLRKEFISAYDEKISYLKMNIQKINNDLKNSLMKKPERARQRKKWAEANGMDTMLVKATKKLTDVKKLSIKTKKVTDILKKPIETKNIYEKNVVYEDNTKIGFYGGECTCPDGHKYMVGNLGGTKKCGSLACNDGKAGECQKKLSLEWMYRGVNCGKLINQISEEEKRIKEQKILKERQEVINKGIANIKAEELEDLEKKNKIELEKK